MDSHQALMPNSKLSIWNDIIITIQPIHSEFFLPWFLSRPKILSTPNPKFCSCISWKPKLSMPWTMIPLVYISLVSVHSCSSVIPFYSCICMPKLQGAKTVVFGARPMILLVFFSAGQTFHVMDSDSCGISAFFAQACAAYCVGPDPGFCG